AVPEPDHLWETTMTTIITNTNTEASPDGPATDTGLGPVTYRPGATPDTPDLVLYAVITVHGRLTIVAATPADAPVHALHRRTGTGQARRCALLEGVTAWADAGMQVENAAGNLVAYRLAAAAPYPGAHYLRGPVVFTGTDADTTRPIGLTRAQVQLLREL